MLIQNSQLQTKSARHLINILKETRAHHPNFVLFWELAQASQVECPLDQRLLNHGEANLLMLHQILMVTTKWAYLMLQLRNPDSHLKPHRQESHAADAGAGVMETDPFVGVIGEGSVGVTEVAVVEFPKHSEWRCPRSRRAACGAIQALR